MCGSLELDLLGDLDPRSVGSLAEHRHPAVGLRERVSEGGFESTRRSEVEERAWPPVMTYLPSRLAPSPRRAVETKTRATSGTAAR